MEGTTNRAKKNPQTDPEKNPQIFLHPLSIRGVTRFNLLLEYKLPQFDNPRAGLTLLQKVLRWMVFCVRLLVSARCSYS
jgi:hypothetical protein